MKVKPHKKSDRVAFFTWAPERYHFWRRTRHHEQHHHFAKPMTFAAVNRDLDQKDKDALVNRINVLRAHLGGGFPA